MIRSALVMCALAGVVACQDRPAVEDSTAANSAASQSAEPGANDIRPPWWVSWRIPPADSAIEGIPVRQVDSSWTAATALATVTPPPGVNDTSGTFQMLGARFVMDGDFNHDGRADRALVGTYRAKDGEEGRFVAIVTRAESGAWEKSFVHTLPGAAAFSALIQGPRGNEPTWIECMECDTSTDIRWRRTEYEAIVHSCCDDDVRPADSPRVARPPEE